MQRGDKWGRKAWRCDGHHKYENLTHVWKGDGRGRGYGVFRLASNGKASVNLGFNNPLSFDNQTLFCVVLGF
jgi:hypothetical protein